MFYKLLPVLPELLGSKVAYMLHFCANFNPDVSSYLD